MIPAINGERLVVGPHTPRQQIEHVIEPVRIAGWRGGASPCRSWETRSRDGNGHETAAAQADRRPGHFVPGQQGMNEPGVWR